MATSVIELCLREEGKGGGTLAISSVVQTSFRVGILAWLFTAADAQAGH